MAHPISAACLALHTLLSGGQLFCSRGTWVYLLKHLFLVRTLESFIPEEFIALIMSLMKSTSLIFLYNARRENLKVNQSLIGATVLKRLVCSHFQSSK